jgi:hypothetical protein
LHLSRENEVDLIDVAPLVLFPIATGIVFGVWTISVSAFGTWSPTDVVFSAAGVDWTWGFLIALVSIAAIIGTNEIDGSNYETWEYGVVAFAFFSPVLWKFVPSFQDFISGSDALILGLWMVTAFAAGYVSYTE